MSRRKKRRQDLRGSKWRVKGPLEDAILFKVAEYIRKESLGDKAFQFIFSMMNNASKSISVRQKWYLAFLASKTRAEFDMQETEWINDVLSQECPAGFTPQANLTISAKAPVNMTVIPQPAVLIGAQRKIRE